jgi:hypothetical protein
VGVDDHPLGWVMCWARHPAIVWQSGQPGQSSFTAGPLTVPTQAGTSQSVSWPRSNQRLRGSRQATTRDLERGEVSARALL